MNWFWKPKTEHQIVPELTSSILYDEDTFYKKFIKDMSEAKNEVIIESPFITQKRLNTLKSTFEKLNRKGVKIFIFTKDPNENDEIMAEYSEEAIRYFEALGIQVLLIKGGHHRKLAMIDRNILWEGSLNILSQCKSREFMRRINSKNLAEELFKFLGYNKLKEF